jgi:phosphoribosyl-AMP cyclohydrolase / phosphoribosyl-ATP pyrophosphohydrolase
VSAALDLDLLDFDKGGGLVTVVVQDAATGAVLMLAHADREALAHTLASGQMHFHSRTRGLWRKGATSGNVLAVESLSADCDGDAVLARVRPAGPTCHTGARSCFGEGALAPDALAVLDRVIAARAAGDAPAGSWTRRLLDDRNLRLKKLAEEALELAVACADEDQARAIEETADLIYHALVALRATGAGLEEVRAALARRAG